MRPILLHALLAAIFLSGCGSDDDGGTLSDATVPLSNYGVIRVDHDSITPQTQLDAVFCDLNSPTEAADIDAQFLTGIDSCTVSNEGSTNVDITAPLVCSAELPAESVSAGLNLTFSSAAGTFADLPRLLTDGETTYTTNVPLPRPPNEVTLDIPGDTFPAFSAVQIPDLEDLVVTSPATGDVLRSDTTITWNAAIDGDNSRLLLTATDANVTVDCSLADDGDFSFTAETQAELGELFGASSFSIRRQNLTSPTRGDSGLVIITSFR